MGIVVVVLAVVVGSFLWKMLNPPELPDPASRDYVEKQLAHGHGVPMALPVTLPPGYKPTRFWGWVTGADGKVQSRDATFFPTEDAGADGRIVGVQLCVESATDDHDNCGIDSDNNSVVRRIEGVRVVIDLSDHDTANRAAWQTIPFTTDLGEVTWLH